MGILLTEEAGVAAGGGIVMVVYLVLIFGFFYLFMIKHKTSSLCTFIFYTPGIILAYFGTKFYKSKPFFITVIICTLCPINSPNWT